MNLALGCHVANTPFVWIGGPIDPLLPCKYRGGKATANALALIPHLWVTNTLQSSVTDCLPGIITPVPVSSCRGVQPGTVSAPQTFRRRGRTTRKRKPPDARATVCLPISAVAAGTPTPTPGL